MKPIMNSAWEDGLARADTGTPFFESMLAQILLILGVLPVLISLGLLAYFVHPSDAILVLHYNVYFGVDLLGLWWQAYVLPLLGLFFVLMHALLARRLYNETERIASYLLLFSSSVLSCGLLVATVSIAFINY